MQRVFATALAFSAFFLSIFISRTVFERLPHLSDEVAYLYQARVFARGNIVIDSPNPRSPFWQPFVVDYQGKRFSKYTPGWSLILSVGVKLGTPYVINAWLAMLTMALTYRLGRDMLNSDTGLIAAALLTASPMFLLLSGTLMGHTTALFLTMAFVYAYRHIEQGHQQTRWGIIAGITLGLLVITRPLTAIGIATPFILYSGLRVLWTVVRARQQFWQTLVPLLWLSGFTMLIALIVPVYNYQATGDPAQNLYTLVWDYDRVGFGETFGRNGHTVRKGLRQTGWDLSLTAADFLGWQIGELTEQQKNHMLARANRYPGNGISWLLLPFGVIAGLVGTNSQRRWTILLILILLCLIGVHVAYWIGSQRYSTRYYAEGVAAAALICAIFPAWVAVRWRRLPIYGLLIVVIVWSSTTYTIPRLQILRGFNGVTLARIDEINAVRQTDKPVVIVLTGDGMTWRANGTLMVSTSPYLDSDIVLARNPLDSRYLAAILAMFPDREIIYMGGEGSDSWLLPPNKHPTPP